MIVCCGSAIVDLVPHAVPGGCNMNVAITAARLGAPTAFLGRLSTDEFGGLLLRHMTESGVALDLVERGPERTARAIVTTAPTPTFTFDADGAADSALSQADLRKIGPGPHIIHGGTNVDYRGTTAQVLATLIEHADGLVSCDPNIRPSLIGDRDDWARWHERWASRAGLYRCSDEDMEWIWPGRSVDSVAAEMLDKHAAVFILTRGSRGCMVYGRDWQLVVSAPRVTVVDAVGAGDAFIGSILASLHTAGVRTAAALAEVTAATWLPMIEQAVQVAAIVCERPGADPPWLWELSAISWRDLGLRVEHRGPAHGTRPESAAAEQR